MISRTKIKSKRSMYWLGGFFVLTFVIPNTTNFRERRAFSDERRLETAMELYLAGEVNDSVTVAPGAYYERGKFWTIFLGEKQRDIWKTPVKVRVFDYSSAKGGLEPYELGGGQQTISMRLKDPEGRKWALRSVNKDQKTALPKFFRITFMRFLMRDGVAAMNPYAHLIVPGLAEPVGIYFNTPQLVMIPYDSSFGEYNRRMAGRVAYLEQHLNSSWKGADRYGDPIDIVNTEEMLEIQKEKGIPVDTTLYLKTRLFDMLINDWDRHEGNWEWALATDDGEKVFEPIPKDRDMAFYQFDEGLVSHITLLFVNKFQSFDKDYGNIAGLVKQSREQDIRILSRLNKERFIEAATGIQEDLTPEVVTAAFRRYPDPVYKKHGRRHAEILQARLKKLPDVAARFHELLQVRRKK